MLDGFEQITATVTDVAIRTVMGMKYVDHALRNIGARVFASVIAHNSLSPFSLFCRCLLCVMIVSRSCSFCAVGQESF